MKLITLSQFVLEKDEQIRKGESDVYDFTMSVTDYALFLQRPLELGMFVPCDEYGFVLEEPIIGQSGNEQYEGCTWDEYHRALEKTIFKGFYVKEYEEPKDNVLGVIKNDNNRYIGILLENGDGFWELNEGNKDNLIENSYLLNTELTPTALEESRLITLI